MRVLICGGAGYIGSHMCKLLSELGHEISLADDFSTGHKESVKWGRLFEGDLADPRFVEDLFRTVQPEGVLHFAAKSIVSESTRDPALYYRGNVGVTLNILERVRRTENCIFVFSSTAAIFGAPVTKRINESHPRVPINTYGRSKLQVEEILSDYWTAYRLPSVSFRYFNAAGADWKSGIGEAHEPETHLIPRVLESVLGRIGPISIFGDDYDTSDGTCVRDYIHVNDLCHAHLAGLEFLRANPGAHAFNLGNGEGFSVREIIRSAENVVGKKIQFQIADRRRGDPSYLVADASKAAQQLGWSPSYKNLHEIIESAWRWHLARHY